MWFRSYFRKNSLLGVESPEADNKVARAGDKIGGILRSPFDVTTRPDRPGHKPACANCPFVM